MNFEQFGKNLNSFLSSQKILDNLPDMYLYVDSEGNIKDSNINAKNNLGVSDDITINELFSDALSAIRKSAKYKKAVLLKTKTPNEFLELTASKIDKDYIVCIRDNTKIINDNIEKDAIDKFNNEKNAMIAKLENEFKAPLNSITGFCQGLVDGIGGEITEKQEKYLKIIKEKSKEVNELFDKFINFSYAESLFYEAEFKKFDIVLEIKEILKEFDKTTNHDNVNVEFLYENIESRNVYNDLNAIKKTLTNILETALNETDSGNIQIILSNPDDETFISYGLDENKKYMQIKIKDTRTTITPDEIKHICNPYAQIERNKKHITKSLSFGTVSILIKRANGFFNISSENGNLYNIIIPIEKEEDE